MKLIIPPECQIGALKYSIRFNDWLLNKLDYKAHCSHKDQVIYLHTGLSPEGTFEDLIHELYHISSWTSAHDLEENSIKGNANCLTQALISLGIEPDFSLIPEGKL